MSSYVKEVNFNSRIKRTQEEKDKGNELLQQKKKEDSKLVSGIFKNLEVQGGDLEFAYRAYAGEPIQVYYFKDGERYTIPIGVAKHINNDTRVPIHSNILGADGKLTTHTKVEKFKQRYQFLSTEYN